MKKVLKSAVVLFLLWTASAFTGCGDDVTRNAPFDNKVYIDAASKTETMQRFFPSSRLRSITAITNARDSKRRF
mgnify:CR=1 FL=1